MNRSATRRALALTGLYVALAALWYLLSDWLLASVFPDPLRHWPLHPALDLGALALGGVPLFLILRSQLARRQLAEDAQLASERAEEHARGERDRLTRILDAMEDGIYIVNARREVQYVNPTLIRERGPVLGRSCHEYLYGRPEICPACPLEAVMAGQTVRGEQSASVMGRTYDVIDIPITNPDGSFSKLKIMRDITDRRRAEEERERLLLEVDAQRALFQTTLELAPVGIAVFEGGTQLRAKWCNPAYREFLDESLRTGDIPGQPLEALIPRAKASGLVDLFRQVAATRQPYVDNEYAYEGFARGTTYWRWALISQVANDGDVPDLMVVAIEVTDQVQARQKSERLAGELEAERARQAARAVELTALLEISRSISATLDLQPLLQTILDQLKITVDYASALIAVQEGDDVVILGYRGSLPLEQVRAFRFAPEEVPAFEAVARRRAPLIIPDLQGEAPEALALRARASEQVERLLAGSRSWLGVPMMIQQRMFGMLWLGHVEPDRYTPEQALFTQAIANQAAVAIQNAWLFARAQELAALQERQRLARELHDSVSQALYGIALGAHAAHEMLQRQPEAVAGALEYVLSQAKAAMSEMRALIFELRPESLQQTGLTAALLQATAAARTRYGVPVDTDICDEPDLPLDTKEALYRVAQEAMHNAGKHAGAQGIVLRLYRDRAGIGLEVRDDGRGFDPAGAFPGHVGLQSMRERIAAVSGALEIESAPGRGTCVRAIIPAPAEKT